MGFNDKFYVKINDIKIEELPGEHTFQKYVPYIMDITFRKYDFEKKGEQITGYSISEINKNLLSYYMYREMGLSESALKPFSFLSHCKVPCDSPCCVKLCGEDNHCTVNIDTHEHVSSDSEEEEHVETK